MESGYYADAVESDDQVEEGAVVAACFSVGCGVFLCCMHVTSSLVIIICYLRRHECPGIITRAHSVEMAPNGDTFKQRPNKLPYMLYAR
jgi:hypothetical protein